MPFFSVVIPLYNKEAFIEETIKSVLNQSFQDFEVIIVDDGSTDGSYKKAASFPSEKITLLKQNNQGVSIARNNGIDTSHAHYIALLDADDIWNENHLNELKKQIDLFPNAGLFCNNYNLFYTETFSKDAQFNFDYETDCLIVPDYFKASIINAVVMTSAVAFSKEKFKNLGGFNPHLKTGQDTDMWIRMALNYEVSFNPAITASYKLYIGNSLSKNEFNVMRYNFINNYINEEKQNPSLKLYLDMNRYSIALRSKLSGPHWVYKKLRKQIDPLNLNQKQKFLLSSPIYLLKFLKRFQEFLIKKEIYLTAFK